MKLLKGTDFDFFTLLSLICCSLGSILTLAVDLLVSGFGKLPYRAE